jgi:hypothetical protein
LNTEDLQSDGPEQAGIAALECHNRDTAQPSKASGLRDLLARPEGLTLDELMAASGWKACSCRSFLTTLRKHRRYKLLRVKEQGVSRYHLERLS